ncbi:hypothetical protein ACFYRI_14730 [Streptomyces microflavus]|uniref:hypothetical protein n=1 Tax=Streptomyces microflavus TaxID=1919 RepID=UPI0036A518D2
MITPRMLPGLRQDLVSWYEGGESVARFAAHIPTSAAEAAAVARRHRATVAAAELYFVNDDMTDLAVTIGRGLDTYAVTSEDLPSDQGLLVWGKRPESFRVVGVTGQPCAVTWTAVADRIEVTLYDHVPTTTPGGRAAHAAVWGRTAPDLSQLWETTLRADGRERPWVVLEDAEDSHQVARTLLATWLLIRQPADARKALHDIEEVPAPRSAQKHIARGGGDPTRTVRYVTLRQSLRPTNDSNAGSGHAGKIYKHRWFVRPHRANQYYPSAGEHRKIWRGPYLVVPAGCEDAPILGGDRVNVLRR